MALDNDGNWIPPDKDWEKVRAGEDAEEKEKLDKAKNENNYVDYLTTDYDSIKADTNKDGKVSLDEIRAYIVYKEEYKPIIKTENHQYYHLDYSFYILIGIACITSIIVAWIRQK